MNDMTTTFLGNPYDSEINPDEFLKKSFSKLWGKNIPEVDIKSDDIKREFTKYHYLILNKLYFDKNDLEYTQGILNNSTKNAIKHNRKSVLDLLSDKRKGKMLESLSVFGKREINEKLISYPLFFMWEYINSNLEELKTWNEKQIDFAEKFGLSHLQDVKTIVEVLWFNNELNWSTVNLPVLTFKWLKTELESVEASWILWSINWNSLLLSFSSSLKVESFENLYYWAVALWYKEKMWIENVKMPTMRMLNVLNYVKRKLWKPDLDSDDKDQISYIITEEWIQRIYIDNLHLFVKKVANESEEEYKIRLKKLEASKIAQIKSNIRWVLRWFGYKLWIDWYEIKEATVKSMFRWFWFAYKKYVESRK